MKSGSNLERIILSGEFAVTAELGPPMGSDGEVVLKKAKLLKGMADAFNITDNQTAIARLSSIAAAKMILDEGLEPIMQMTCRDRNRIAMQADFFGAYALGIKNCLCIAGDHQSFGKAGKLQGHPGAKNVYDVDSIQLCKILKDLREEGKMQGGDSVEGRPRFFIGAAWTPMGDPKEFRILRLKKKVDAGAQFIQTQGIYDMEEFKESMKKVVDMGLHERTAILGGIIVPKSAGMLKYMNRSVAGVTVPKEMIKRIADAEDSKAEGIKVTVELIQQLREIEGVKGVHIQAIEWEAKVPEIVKSANLLPRPELPPLTDEELAELEPKVAVEAGD